MPQETWEFRCLFDMLTFHWVHTHPGAGCCVTWVLTLSGISYCVFITLCTSLHSNPQCARAPCLHIFMSTVVLALSILLNEVALVWFVFPRWLTVLSLFPCMFLFIYVLVIPMLFWQVFRSTVHFQSDYFCSWVFGVPCISCVLAFP